MYLSKVIIRNYRSIKSMEIDFQSGKNVIIGKNNAGKSNIIKAIDLVLGETVPTYYKYENITETDFYTEKREEKGQQVITASKEIVIICLLQRSPNEHLNFDIIDKCTGFFKLVQNKKYRPLSYDENRIRVTDFNAGEINEIFKLDVNEEDDGAPGYIPRQTNLHWVDSKLSNQRKFSDELQTQFQFAYVFRALKNGDKISKEIRFLFREQEHCDWHLAFSAPIRNELLQSAIISSFRDPQNILRINQWSWFGKLLRASIDTENAELQDASINYDRHQTKCFPLYKDINDSRIQVAFPETEISIQFNPDTKIDIYKSALIYVDDGFNSQLQDKGSGIQSAVTIGLFNYYIRNFAHQSSSLLIVEEPEIYLHPQARACHFKPNR
ncbi:MAG: ATP-binding protein [Lewinellaceae bacterium]|nr:ATP-binding protein [Lewinellaceae bacterium]